MNIIVGYFLEFAGLMLGLVFAGLMFGFIGGYLLRLGEEINENANRTNKED